MNPNDKFEYFSADTPDPINKYTQPKPNTNSTGKNGYPETDVKTTGIQQRGAGAASKGKTARGPMA